MKRVTPVVLVIAVVYLDMLGLGLAYPVLPKLIAHFENGDISNASYIFGLLAAAYALMQFLFAPLLGAISDRFGRRPVILLSLLGMGLNYILLWWAPSLVWLTAGRLIAGAMGASFSAAGAYIADVTPPEKRAQSFGLIGAAFGFGFITGPVLGGFLGAIDLHLPFLAAAGLSGLNLLFCYFMLPESLAPENRRAFTLKSSNPVGAVRALARYPGVLALLAIFVLATFANRVSEMTWVLFTAYRFHWDTLETGISLAAVGVMFVVGQGVMPRVFIPRLGERRTVLLGLLVSVVTATAYGLVTQGWMVYPLMVLGVFGWVTAAPATQALMSKAVPPNEQGLLQGTFASLSNLTSIAGPPIWTGLFGFFVSKDAPVIVPGAAYFASAMVFFAAWVLAVKWLGTPSPTRASAQG